MHLSVAHYSSPGGRDSNQDYIGFSANESMGCFSIADGAGGYQGGAVAARTVVAEVLTRFGEAPATRCTDASWSIDAARHALHRARLQYPEWADMNTTIAILMLDTATAHAAWSHLGDSRIYLFRNGRAHLLTHDHSVMQAMLDAGYARGPLRGRPERGSLYASVGCGEPPSTDVCNGPLVIRPGDAFLLCSDGFWDVVDEATMEDALTGAQQPEQWITRMVERIVDPASRERDNFSALAIWVGARLEITRILEYPPAQPAHGAESGPP
jgi:serine/threonine protein phosphatase PrpC